MKIDEDKEQGVNYNKYETHKNLSEKQLQEIVEESIEKMKPPNPNNINFHD
jgi:molybdopterin synthase catalytic subunit